MSKRLENVVNLPAGLRPPVLAGVASPPIPSAASPARGLLPSLPIWNNDEEIHDWANNDALKIPREKKTRKKTRTWQQWAIL